MLNTNFGGESSSKKWVVLLNKTAGEVQVNSSTASERRQDGFGLRSVEVTQPVYIIGDIFGWARLPMLGPVTLDCSRNGRPHP